MDKQSGESKTGGLMSPEERVVYVMPRTQDSEWGDDFDFVAAWNVVCGGWKTILLFTLLFSAAGAAYAFAATEKFRAEAVIMPAESTEKRGLASQFGGLATLAGINLSGDDRAEPLAVLRSRSLAQSFVEENGLTGVLSRESGLRPWIGTVLEGDETVQVRKAVDFFDRRIRTVTEDRKTGIVTVAIEWRDPQIAADWANALVARVNDQMRERSLKEASENVAYLKAELAATNLLSLQQSISKLLELELQTIMLAKGNREYSYRVIDRATPPIERYWPKRGLIILLGFLSGIATGVVALLVRKNFAASSATRG